MMFKDRQDAATQLAAQLIPYKNKDVVVLAIPKGGLPLAVIIAKVLNAPLDVALSKKIGHPNNPEYAIGAVSLQDVVLNRVQGIPEHYIAQEVERIRKDLQEKFQRYHHNRPPTPLLDKTVIIVDDGIATGNTIQVTAQLVHRQHPFKIIVAVPVAPKKTVEQLQQSNFIDEVVCIHAAELFYAVGQFYVDFGPVAEAEAIAFMEESGHQDA